MRRHDGKYLRYGVLGLGLVLASLSGCSSFVGNSSSFGSAQLTATADVPNLGSYTADKALAEARAHFRNNDFGYAAALYKHVVDLSPKDPEGYVGLSASYDRLGRFDLSDRVYASLYQLSGGTVQYYNNLGYSEMLRGNLPAALTNFRRAGRLDPHNPVVANNLQIVANVAAQA